MTSATTSEEKPKKYKISKFFKFTIPLTTPSRGKMEASFTLEDIIGPIANIHRSSIGKYSPLSWERVFMDEYDCTFCNNMDAIFRHSFHMWEGQLTDPESCYEHIDHVLCRWQMANTVYIRAKDDDKNTPRQVEYTNEDLKTYTASDTFMFDFITPETFYILGHMHPGAITPIYNNYREMTSKDLPIREWVSSLMEYHYEFRNFPSWKRYLKFSHDLVGFSLFMKTKDMYPK